MPNASGPRDIYRELFERSADAILIIEGESFVDCNAAAVEMLRCSDRAQVLQTHPSELSPPRQPDGRDSFEKANEMIAIAFERGNHRFEWMHRRADGEEFPVEVLLTAVQASPRRLLHVVWRDVTERKLLEQQVQQAQKLEAVGTLAGGIAHDFNNLLVAILGHSEFLGRQLKDSPEGQMHVNEILRAGHRAADLVRQLLAFGRKQQRQVSVLDLNELVRDQQGLIRGLIGEAVEFVTELDAQPLCVWGDAGQLEQVLLNLVSNARDAMPSGGRLVLRTQDLELNPGLDVGQADALEPGHYVLLTVSDTGVGMDAATVARACEPFFTTKSVGEGTGLGLATVHGIVKQHGGALRLHSAPGLGTTVRVYLPLSRERVSSEPSTRAEPDVVRGSETVLVVEDEPGVAQVACEALRQAGYEVLLAADGAEGLEMFRAHAGEIALIVSDVIMPRMSGPDMAEALAQDGSDVPVLFMSGYTSDVMDRYCAGARPLELVEKPFSIPKLLARVRALIDGR